MQGRGAIYRAAPFRLAPRLAMAGGLWLPFSLTMEPNKL